jgi:hypothetical protein
MNGRFSSSLYTFERFDTTGSSKTHLRTFQMLNFNFGKNNFWIRTYLNLESDLAENLVYDPRLRVYNLFADIRNIWNVVSLKLGRQPLYNSIAGGLFDGGTLGLDYSGFKLTAYYGGNVPAYQKLEIIDNWGDNYILGGELAVLALQDWRFALKYVDKNFKSTPYTAQRLDENLNPIEVLIENKSNQYKFISGEVSYDMKDVFYVNSRYDYDMNFEATSRFELSGRYEEVDNLGFTLYYNYRQPKVRYNSIFSVFDYGNTWEIEGGADYQIEDKYTLIGKFANVSYKEETSQRLTLGISSPWGSITGRKTFGYAGEMDAVSVYGAQTILEGLLTPSFGFTFTRYRLSENEPHNELISLLAGLNYRPVRILSLDVQGQYLNNKIYKNDWRLLFKFNYWFNTIFE